MELSILDRQIDRYCEENHIYGVIRVTVGGEIRFRKEIGFADIENSVPFSDDSMFTFYSISKPLCTLGLLKLMEKGLVDLDAHPGGYVPEAMGFDSRVTVRHLLHHISGLPDFEQNRSFAETHFPGYADRLRDQLTELVREPMYFVPGTGGMYANINFILCALIIENVTGRAYAEYMKNEVFVPLGMKTAVVDNENLTIPHRVKGYVWDGERLVEIAKSHNWLFGAGDVVGTADDVYCLNRAIKERLLIGGDTWEDVLTPSPLNSMGMGCAVTRWHGKKRITHSGGHIGFRTMHIQLPEDDFDIILLSNCGFGNARDDISEMIHEAFYGDARGKTEAVAMDKGYI